MSIGSVGDTSIGSVGTSFVLCSTGIALKQTNPTNPRGHERLKSQRNAHLLRGKPSASKTATPRKMNDQQPPLTLISCLKEVLASALEEDRFIPL